MPSIAPSKSTTTTPPSLRAGRIPYLNSAPFFHGLALGAHDELIDCVPRELGERAAAGEITAGLLPLADVFRLQEMFERVGRFGIAVRGRARSVTLFSRKPIRQLDGCAIAVTEETSTSAVLLRLLLEQRYHVQPKEYMRVSHSEAARPGSSEGRAGDALLLIGDEALRFQQTNTRYPFEIDVAFEWWLWQHLPCVFAVWAIRKDAAPEDKARLERGLARALAVNAGELATLAQERSASLGVPAADLKIYLSNFIYRLGPSEDAAIQQFQRLADEHRLL